MTQNQLLLLMDTVPSLVLSMIQRKQRKQPQVYKKRALTRTTPRRLSTGPHSGTTDSCNAAGASISRRVRAEMGKNWKKGNSRAKRKGEKQRKRKKRGDEKGRQRQDTCKTSIIQPDNQTNQSGKNKKIRFLNQTNSHTNNNKQTDKQTNKPCVQSTVWQTTPNYCKVLHHRVVIIYSPTYDHRLIRGGDTKKEERKQISVARACCIAPNPTGKHVLTPGQIAAACPGYETARARCVCFPQTCIYLCPAVFIRSVYTTFTIVLLLYMSNIFLPQPAELARLVQTR